VIGEIPGTDKLLKNEVVLLGAHIDSYSGGTGAADNASGCIVMMEALRILKNLDVAPRRTIRVALWGGEEQGLNGSRGYVEKYLVDSKQGSTNLTLINLQPISIWITAPENTGASICRKTIWSDRYLKNG